MVEDIKAIQQEVKDRYGSPRIHRELRRRGTQAVPVHDGLQAQSSGGGKPAEPRVRGSRSEQDVGVGHHVHSDGREMAVPVFDPGPSLPPGSGLVDEPADDERSGGKGSTDDGAASQAAEGVDFALGPRVAILQPRVSAVGTALRDPTEHEPQRRLLG